MTDSRLYTKIGLQAVQIDQLQAALADAEARIMDLQARLDSVTEPEETR